MESLGLSPILLLSVIGGYFLLLLTISYFTSKNSDTQSFFNADKQSPWYLVAFGMIGATLSGVTFISVPGWVADSQFSYMQMVLGYLLGYYIIATVLMPMYYKMNLVSIYSYLEDRFGVASYKTGAAFFLLSRTIQASFRLYLVAIVLQAFVMDAYGIPFFVTVMMTILLIWLYTFRGGIKTIVWTDTLQTLCMIVAVIATIIAIADGMQLSLGNVVLEIKNSDYASIFNFEGGWSDPKNFFKQFFSGAFIAVVMTGLDQDMMQKNLTCKNIGEAQKNMFWFSIVLVFANIIFLALGAMLYMFAAQKGIELPAKGDLLYPTIALSHLSPFIGILFVLGLIAAAYSSADSALTALTTSFCVDFLNFGKSSKSEQTKRRTRWMVHVMFSFLLLGVITIFYYINDDAVISQIFTAAGYTYGPLLGLYAFGFFTHNKVWDIFVPIVCIFSPILTFVINRNSAAWLDGYQFGYELLLLNGLITFVGLFILSICRSIFKES